MRSVGEIRCRDKRWGSTTSRSSRARKKCTAPSHAERNTHTRVALLCARLKHIPQPLLPIAAHVTVHLTSLLVRIPENNSRTMFIANMF